MLAGALAAMLQSKHLYVAYSLEAGPACPVVPASIQETELQQPRRRGLISRLLGR